MRFQPTPIAGVFLLEPEPLRDERGFFARTWCRREFAGRGLNPDLAQCSLSYNRKRGTLRGLHYQAPPWAEAKLVRCLRGAIYDVALDLRPQSPTFKQWYAAELSADDRRMLYIPEGCAHGFQTLSDDAEVFYQISQFHDPASARGVRWDDPAFGIAWPLQTGITISARDQSYPFFPPQVAS
jgi:dTDP-4-dehydrorhamnose 3,5-epimerase